MRFTFLPLLAVAFYGVTFVAEKVLLRGRKLKTGANWDKGSLALFVCLPCLWKSISLPSLEKAADA